MKKTLQLILLLLTISCSDKSEKLGSQNKIDKKQPSTSPQTKLVDGPTRSFEALVQILDSMGYKSDTVRVTRLKNYKELLDGDIQLFGTFPFYKMNEENTKVLWWNTIARDEGDSINTAIFREAETVWGYFYQKEEDDNITIDGVIEQWTFRDTVTAQIAMDNLKAIYPLPYFNTQPYYMTDGQYLFIFHTRADAFSYRQKDFLNKFREISLAANIKPGR